MDNPIINDNKKIKKPYINILKGNIKLYIFGFDSKSATELNKEIARIQQQKKQIKIKKIQKKKIILKKKIKLKKIMQI